MSSANVAVLKRTFWSPTYALGAALGAAFTTAIVWLVASEPPDLVLGLLLGGLASLFCLAVVFAAGRARVVVTVGADRVRFSRWLRRTVDVPRSGTGFSIVLGDDFDFVPGPVLIKDRATSNRVRDIIHAVRRVTSDHVHGSRTPDEYFAAVTVRPATGKEVRVLLPGVHRMEEVDDVRKALGIDDDAAAAAAAAEHG